MVLGAQYSEPQTGFNYVPLMLQMKSGGMEGEENSRVNFPKALSS